MEESGTRAGPIPDPPSEAPYHELWVKPFRENTDPSFLWLGPQYRDGFAALRSAVLQHAGVIVLTGDVGTGKTMLARALGDSLRAEGVRVGKLAFAGLHPQEFWNAVSLALELPRGDDTGMGVPARIDEFLHQTYARREKVLLIVDEAQDLAPAVLDGIEALARAGLRAGRGKVNVINILLVGQPAVEALAGLRGGDDRVVVRLSPLPPEQVAAYIDFRLRVSGADRQLFSADAVADIATASAGVPRLINRICDCALQVASKRNERAVSAEVIAETLSDFGLTAPGGAFGMTGPRRPARRAIRRAAYAAALTMAVALGAIAYQRGAATHAGADHRPDETGAARAIPVGPPAGSEPIKDGEAPATRDGEAPATASVPSDGRHDAESGRRDEGEARPGGGLARGNEGADGPKPEARPLPVQPAMGPPRRPEIVRIPRAARPETRLDRLPRERAAIAAPALDPERARSDSAAARGRAAADPAAVPGAGAVVPGGAATASAPRASTGGSDEPDDPAAIINWLLRGQRGAER
jgi:type II secretory pathway predicted ATPase ExeA